MESLVLRSWEILIDGRENGNIWKNVNEIFH